MNEQEIALDNLIYKFRSGSQLYGTVTSNSDKDFAGIFIPPKDYVIGLSRDQQHPNKRCANTSELHVLKCRFTGRTGKAGFLLFDDRSGRMMQTTEPLGYYRSNNKTANEY